MFWYRTGSNHGASPWTGCNNFVYRNCDGESLPAVARRHTLGTKVAPLLEDFSQVFEPGKSEGAPVQIQLEDRAAPKCHEARRAPFALLPKADEAVEKLVERGMATPIFPILKKKSFGDAHHPDSKEKTEALLYGNRASAPPGSNPSRCPGCPMTTLLRLTFSTVCSGRRQVATKLSLLPKVRLRAPEVEVLSRCHLLRISQSLYSGGCLGRTGIGSYARCTRFTASSPNGTVRLVSSSLLPTHPCCQTHNAWPSRKLPMQEDGARSVCRRLGTP